MRVYNESNRITTVEFLAGMWKTHVEGERANGIHSFSVPIRLFSFPLPTVVSFALVCIWIAEAIRLAFTDARSLNSLYVLVC